MVSPNVPRILFLDDAPDRALPFLAAHPGAVWVQTVEQCLELLQRPWDEVHLDHDSGRNGTRIRTNVLRINDLRSTLTSIRFIELYLNNTE